MSKESENASSSLIVIGAFTLLAIIFGVVGVYFLVQGLNNGGISNGMGVTLGIGLIILAAIIEVAGRFIARHGDSDYPAL